MDRLFKYAESQFGLPSDQLKLIFCLLIAYPLSSAFVRIPRDQIALKHLFNIGVSVWFLVGVFSLWSGLAQLLAGSLFTYVVAGIMKKDHRMPWIVFGVVLSHLMVNHTIRAYNNIGYNIIEITGSQMVLVMKLSTFAWNVWDGQQDPTTLDTSQLATRVTEFPSLLAFLGYVFYFPGLLVGPTCDFTDYDSLCTETLFTKPSPTSTPALNTRNPSSRKRLPEGRKRAAYKNLAIGLAFLFIFAATNGQWDYPVLLTDWWLSNPFWKRFLYIQAFGFVQRTKYYGVWLITEGASILTGLGFNGFTPSGETRWDRTKNIHILRTEFPENAKMLLDAWNINTNVWLRNCVYKRVTPRGKKPGFRSTMMTFFVSAFWHGTYPGYYLCFLLGGFIQTVARKARTYFRPFTIPPIARPGVISTVIKSIYDLLGIVLSIAIINYMVAPFQVLSLKGSLQAWARMDWYGHIIAFGGLGFFMSGGSTILTSVLKKKGVVVGSKKGKVEGANGVTTVLPATPGANGMGWPPTVPPVIESLVQVKEKGLAN